MEIQGTLTGQSFHGRTLTLGRKFKGKEGGSELSSLPLCEIERVRKDILPIRILEPFVEEFLQRSVLFHGL